MLTKFFLLFCGLLVSTSAIAESTISITVSEKTEMVQPMDSSFLYYDFGRQFVNSKRFVRYDVTNTGTAPLQFRSADISGSYDFDGYHNCSNGLLPRQQCIFEISYWPLSEGFDFGRFSISFSGNNTIVVDLRGEGFQF